MAFRFDLNQSATRNLRRIATTQVEKTIAELSDGDLDRVATVHQARKRCKKIRGLLRLVRPSIGDTYDDENIHFRAAARKLSVVRDADAFKEAFERFRGDEGQSLDSEILDSIASRLDENAQSVARDEVDMDLRVAEFVADMQAALDRIPSWRCTNRDTKAVSGGFVKTYRRGYEAMAKAADIPSDENLHEWRKRVKYHWYHVRLVRDHWKRKFKKRAKRLKQLSDVLGDDHDLAVLRQFVIEEPSATPSPKAMFELVQALDCRRHRLQHEARQLEKPLYVESPRSWKQRLRHRIESE